jgi:hypothetical protein
VTDGVESAVRQAKAAAGDKDVGVSGAEVGQRCDFAGLAASRADVLLASGAGRLASLNGGYQAAFPAAAGPDDEPPVAATAPAFGGCPSARTQGTVDGKPDGKRRDAGSDEEVTVRRG